MCVILTVTPQSVQFFVDGSVSVGGHGLVVLCITQLSEQIMVKHTPEPMSLSSSIGSPSKEIKKWR